MEDKQYGNEQTYLENVDESFSLDQKGDNFGADIVPFFKVISKMRENGLINDEDSDFKRDLEFEKLLVSPSFNPDNLTEKEIIKLNEYMSYIQTLIFSGDQDKMAKMIGKMSKENDKNKKKKVRWRDLKKK